MKPLGWVFLLSSTCIVWGLVIWCYAKVLAAPQQPPDQAKGFHSA